MVDYLLVALITAFPVIARKTSDWENAKVAACILKIGGNFCRQFHTLAAIVLFIYTQWETSVRKDLYIFKTSQLMAGNIQFNTPEFLVDKEGHNFIISF